MCRLPAAHDSDDGQPATRRHDLKQANEEGKEQSFLQLGLSFESHWRLGW